MKPLLPLLALLLLPACEDNTHEPTTYVPEESEAAAAVKLQPEGEVNAVNEYGMTLLARLSQLWRHYHDDMEQSLREEDEDMAAYYREELSPLEARIRELLREGADPWARSLDKHMCLAPCARQYWTEAFVETLRKEGFTITDSPE